MAAKQSQSNIAQLRVYREIGDFADKIPWDGCALFAQTTTMMTRTAQQRTMTKLSFCPN